MLTTTSASGSRPRELVDPVHAVARAARHPHDLGDAERREPLLDRDADRPVAEDEHARAVEVAQVEVLPVVRRLLARGDAARLACRRGSPRGPTRPSPGRACRARCRASRPRARWSTIQSTPAERVWTTLSVGSTSRPREICQSGDDELDLLAVRAPARRPPATARSSSRRAGRPSPRGPATVRPRRSSGGKDAGLGAAQALEQVGDLGVVAVERERALGGADRVADTRSVRASAWA